VPERNAILDLNEVRVLAEVSRDGGTTELATTVGRGVQMRYCALEGTGEVAGRHCEGEGDEGEGERREKSSKRKEEGWRCSEVLLRCLVVFLTRF
jgi:hypothetical protein